MNRILLTTIIFLGALNTCLAQASTDSLLSELEKPHPDSVKFNLYKQLIESASSIQAQTHYENILIQMVEHSGNEGLKALIKICQDFLEQGKGDLVLSFTKKGIEICEDTNKKYLSHFYWIEAIVHWRAMNLNKAIESTENGIQSVNEFTPEDSKPNLFTIRGNIYLDKSNTEEALVWYLKAYKLYEKLNDKRKIVPSLTNISNIFAIIQEFDQALYYAREAAAVATEVGKPLQRGLAYQNLARISNRMNMADSSMGHADSAVFYYEKAVENYQLSKSDYQISECYYQLGALLTDKKNFEKGIEYFEKALEIERKLNSQYIAAYALQGLAIAHRDMGHLELAKQYYEKSLSLTHSLGLSNLEKDIYGQLSSMYAEHKDFLQAYQYYDKFFTLHDSLLTEENKQKIMETKALYDIRSQEEQIESLNAKNKIKTIQLYSLIGFGLFALIVIGLILNRYHIVRRTRDKLKELDQTKSHFFTNISHEFRTPLSLILGTIQERLKRATDQKEITDLATIQNNSNKLRYLINQLLDLSKIESGKMSLHIEEVDLETYIRTIFGYFEGLAESKGIDYQFEFTKPQNGFVDPMKVEQILTNLLSNAFKFTHFGGMVKLNASIDKDMLEIKIEDNGLGIPKNKVDKIFDPFYQVDDTTTRAFEGSGIGLALTKELSKIHKGQIKVTSKEGIGTVFYVTIPIARTAYPKAEIHSPQKVATPKSFERLQFQNPWPRSNFSNDLNTDLPWILVVEDNVDMQAFISQILQDDYKIVSVANGKEGFKIALEKVPDLIISDVMMPEMDGLTFCKELKSHPATSHIPVIMLTAKADRESKLIGLSHGASAYLTKPFDTDELKLVIKNIIDNTQLLYRSTQENFTNSHSSPPLPEAETLFLKKVNQHIAENYHRMDFGIDHLADHVCMSRMQLYRKIKAITGETPGQMLRNHRLEVAKALLKEGNPHVGDIVNQVGYNNHSNFAKAFKEYSGFTPSEFIGLENNN